MFELVHIPETPPSSRQHQLGSGSGGGDGYLLKPHVHIILDAQYSLFICYSNIHTGVRQAFLYDTRTHLLKLIVFIRMESTSET